MPELELLEKRIRASAVQNVLLGLFSLGLGGVTVAGAVTCALAENYSQAAFIGLLGLVFIGVTWLFVQSFRKLSPARQSAIYVALTGGDSRYVVWAHLTTGKTTALKVYFRDGDMCTLYANGRDSQTLLALVRQRAPHAILGYGTEQQKAWWEQVKIHRAAGAASKAA